MKTLYFLVLLLLVMPLNGQQGGEITGQLVDSSTGRGIPFANVIALRNGMQILGAPTDYEGYFSLKPLDRVDYIEVSYLGSSKKVAIETVQITGTLDMGIIELKIDESMGYLDCNLFRKPPIIPWEMETKRVISRKRIQRLPHP